MIHYSLIIVLIIALPILAISTVQFGRKYQTATLSKRKANKSKISEDSTGSDNRYPAVSIRPGQVYCPSVGFIVGDRYLHEEAPPLPLPGCTNKKCHCTYVHHTERRTGSSRRSQRDGFRADNHALSGSVDARKSIGRRTGERM